MSPHHAGAFLSPIEWRGVACGFLKGAVGLAPVGGGAGAGYDFADRSGLEAGAGLAARFPVGAASLLFCANVLGGGSGFGFGVVGVVGTESVDSSAFSSSGPKICKRRQTSDCYDL